MGDGPAQASSGPWGIRSLALALGVATGTIHPFTSIILSEQGLSMTEIGLVASAAALIGLAMVPVSGYVADTILGPVRTMQLAALVCGGALLAIAVHLPVLLVAVFFVVGWGVGHACFAPLTDSLVVSIYPSGPGYARVRLLTSLAFAVTAIVAGVIYVATGYGAALLLFAPLAVVLAVAAGTVLPPDWHGRQARRSHAASEQPATRWPLGTVVRLGAVLTVTAMVLFGQTGSNTYFGLLIVELGGNPARVAAAASISAFAEIPAMLAAGWLVARLGPRWTFVIFGALYALAFATWALARNVDLLTASRAISGFAYGGILVSAVLAVRTLVAPDRQATGQAVFQAVCLGVTAIVASAVGGAMHDTVGFTGFFGMCAVLAVAALVVGPLAYPGRGTASARTTAAPEITVPGIGVEP